MEAITFSLKDFNKHIQTSWKDGQVELDFCDLTIGCEDKFIKVHKFIVSTSSPVLTSILKTIENQKPFIYLKGVKYGVLQNIINFIYQGEVMVDEDNIAGFLEVATELKIKGLSKSVDKENITRVQNP